MIGKNKKYMDLTNYNDIRCPVCLKEFNLYRLKEAGYKTCPNCKSNIPPLFLVHDIIVKLNWQDLRILATYSKRWVTQFDMTIRGNQDMVKALENILNKLMPYQPAGTLPVVTAEEAKVEPKKLPLKSPYFGKGMQ